MQVAQLEVDQLEALLVIDAAAYADPWSKRLWKQELARANRFYFAATSGDALVGFGGALLAVDEAHVTTIATDPQHRRRGIASALMLAITEAAIAAGARGITLEVRASNTAAQALYRSFGMATEGVRRNYYEHDNEDAFIMWARDIDGAPYARRLGALRTTLLADASLASTPDTLNTSATGFSARGGKVTTMSVTLILGIETSCDETAASVVRGGADVLSSVVSSQVDLHARYGGVVPEVASRAHVELLVPVVAQALVEAGAEPAEIDAVAATNGPGLVGSLLVGVSAAKSLALVWNKPFVAVNHLEAHLYSCFLEEPDLELPLLVMLVSGGHTMLVAMEDHGQYRVLGHTVDDAAGEAYDKVARYMGLGYPGGPIVDRLAMDGTATIDFPRPMLHDGYNFSFSGLKTSVINHVRKNPDAIVEDVAASFQEAVVDVLVTKATKAAAEIGAKGLCIGGGVAANSRLREAVLDACVDKDLRAFVPSRAFCTDNAAMVAAAGWRRFHLDGPSPLDTGADPNLELPRDRLTPNS